MCLPKSPEIKPISPPPTVQTSVPNDAMSQLEADKKKQMKAGFASTILSTASDSALASSATAGLKTKLGG